MVFTVSSGGLGTIHAVPHGPPGGFVGGRLRKSARTQKNTHMGIFDDNNFQEILLAENTVFRAIFLDFTAPFLCNRTVLPENTPFYGYHVCVNLFSTSILIVLYTNL